MLGSFLDWLLRRRRKSEPEFALPASPPSSKPSPVAVAVAEELADPLAEASDPATPPERLREIVRENDELASRFAVSYTPNSWRVRAAVAGNPNAPSDILARLAGEALEQFIANPVLPLLVMEEPGFVTSLSWTVLRLLVKHRNTPPVLLAAITAIPYEPLAGTARRHIALAGEPAPGEGATSVQECIAGLRTGDAELLTEMLDLDIVPAALISTVQAAIRSAPKGPRGWRRPAERDHETPAERLRRESQPPFTEWPEREGHRIGAARDSRTPQELLQALADRGSESVRLRVARNSATPPEILRILLAPSQRGQENFRRALAANSATPTDVLRALASSRGDYIRWLVSSHPSVEDRVLHTLRKNSICVIRRTARNALLARASLEEATRHAIIAHAREKALVQAAEDTPGTLARFLATLQSGGRIGQSAQEGVATLLHWEDRLAATLNPAATPSDLEQLAEDAIRPVRAAARDRLAGRTVLEI